MNLRLLVGTAALCLGLASAAQPATPMIPRPPHLRPADASSEEAGLWFAADKAELGAKISGELDGDPKLGAYVRSVECRVAPEYCDDLRLYVMDRPFLNAAAAPNGYVEVWSGLLLRARNEAQLAFVLGHETTHFALNHSLASQQAMKRRMNEALVLSLALAAGGVAAGASASSAQAANNIINATNQLVNVVYLAEVAAFFRFSREQEGEADRQGFARAVAAGYDPLQMAAVWRGQIDEAKHSDFEKVRNRPATGSLFDDHPLDGERLDTLLGLAKASSKSGETGAAEFRAAIRPHLAAFLRDDLRRRDYGQTLFIIDQKLADHLGDDGLLNYFRGECFRLRRGDGDVDEAVAAYTKATAYPDAPPEAWREIGAYYEHRHDTARAVAAYRGYLDHAPAAQDRWLIEASLKKLES